MIVLLTFSGPINGNIELDVTVLLLTAVVLNDLGSLIVNVLRGELRVGATAILGFSARFFWLVVGAAFVLAGFGARGVMHGLLVEFAVQFLWGVYRCSTPLGQPSLEHAHSLFLVVPSVFGVTVLARPILELVFGPAYAAAWFVLIVLTGVKLFGAVQAVIGQCLLGIDRPGLNARATPLRSFSTRC